MKKIVIVVQLLCVFIFLSIVEINAQTIYLSGNNKNEFYRLLKAEGLDVKLFLTPEEAIRNAAEKSGVIITAADYPYQAVTISDNLYNIAKAKKLRLFVEFINYYPGINIFKDVYRGRLERGIITSRFFLPDLKEMALVGLNDCHIFKAEVKNPLLSYAKVAGFDVAQYGLDDTEIYPLLFKDKNTMVAMSCLTNFKTARYSPNQSWKHVWETLLVWLTNDKNLQLTTWSSDPSPSYPKSVSLPYDARKNSVKRGAEWLYNGRFLVHPSWAECAHERQGDGTNPFGPPVGSDKPIGDGSNGVLEGHASTIYYDGTEQYRYWMRADVQGEAAMLLASAGNLLNDKKYKKTSENLIDYMFYTADFIKGPRIDKSSPVYGLLGWANTHPYVFYNDDNARAILGVIGASAFLGNERWNKYIVECILANLRTASKQGFQGDNLHESQILENGWKFYHTRDFINPHPHYEAWMLACYLWLYDKTGHPMLLGKAKSAIRIAMDGYYDKSRWTNGIQERTRMILPLSWLVRVEDTPEHRKWLDIVIQDVLKNQVECGAIREELGTGNGLYGNIRSNKEYGLHEAPLNANDTDPVADMLYTSNFAFFSLNEAAHATGNSQYSTAVNKLSDFLTRIQAKSDMHIDMDGAWMRAFDYDRWDYWASNADAGWGAWCTLTGWIQSWIVTTQVLTQNNQSYWGITKNVNVKDQMRDALWMLEE